MKPSQLSPEAKEAISVAKMRESDAWTIEHQTSGRELMYRAARGVFHSVDWSGKHTAVLVGSGNNGGDGYALAQIMAQHGYSVRLFRTSDRFSPEGAYYFEQAVAAGVDSELFTAESDLSQYDIIVDCILGTGFQGVPRGKAAEAIEAVNASGAYVVSVDINSGMNGDTGEAVLAVRSDKTISIGFYKTGSFLGRGPELIGDLINVDIGIVLSPN